MSSQVPLAQLSHNVQVGELVLDGALNLQNMVLVDKGFQHGHFVLEHLLQLLVAVLSTIQLLHCY